MARLFMPLNDKDPEYWFNLAEKDEISAEILRRESGPPEISAYHYHQAAEKMLKGALLLSHASVPFIHDLQRLYGILRECNDELADISSEVINLQSSYADLRYPRGDTLDALELAHLFDDFNRVKLVLVDHFKL
jgi:HEPN domain-containing protein